MECMATRGLRTPFVLLLNDMLEERELYAHTLRAAGHRVIIPEDSGAAYQIATTRPPDIVVTDVRITGSISGLELARRLRSNQRTSTVRIIVLTTVSRPYDSDVALKAGADTFLEKPVSGAVLKAAIERLLPGSVRTISPCRPQSGEASPADALDPRGVWSSTPAGAQSNCPCAPVPSSIENGVAGVDQPLQRLSLKLSLPAPKTGLPEPTAAKFARSGK
jgi:CheY-like chemotaxis protein